MIKYLMMIILCVCINIIYLVLTNDRRRIPRNAPFMNFFVQKIVISSKNVNLINDMYTKPNKVNSILLIIIFLREFY